MENNLQESWREVTLGEIADINYGKDFRKSKFVERDGYPVYSANGIIGYSKEYNLNNETVVLGCRGSVGSVHLTLPKSYITHNCFSIEPYALIPKKFIYYLLKGINMSDVITGTAQPQITITNLSPLLIPFPPLAEQHRIVAKLDAVMQKVESNKQRLEKIPKLLKRFRQSVLAAAVSGKLTEDWREQNKDLESAKSILERIKKEKSKYVKKGKEYIHDSEYETIELPDTWLSGKWDNYLDFSDSPFRRGPFGSALKKEIFISSGYKIYEQYCPINDDCSFARYFIDEKKFNELKNFAVQAGDFLISCSGVTLGRITQVPKIFDEGIINQAILRVRINQTYFDSTFFLLLFKSPYFQRNIFENSTGSAIPNVKGVDELKSIPAPILSLEEQKEIVKRVEQLFAFANKLEVRYKKAKTMLDKLPQSILAKAFRGELVPQDPDDEPASVLLERIKAEKENLAKEKKNKKTKNISH